MPESLSPCVALLADNLKHITRSDRWMLPAPRALAFGYFAVYLPQLITTNTNVKGSLAVLVGVAPFLTVTSSVHPDHAYKT